ncbi:MAG: helix-turn-helix transcriptional regulator [Lachnospiraceae bacterium]|nr:helix-turn-helix transcriptional regulator [Lachnospiraceae bacterium]
MLVKETGVESGSDIYLMTPSENAINMLFYPISCGHYFTAEGYKIEREDYGNYLLLYLIKGKMSMRSEERVEVVKPGQVCFLDCHLPHEYHAVGHAEFVWVHINGSNVGAFYKKVREEKKSFVFSVRDPESTRKQMLEFVYVYRNGQFTNEWKQSLKVYRLLISFLEDSSAMPDDESDSISDITQKALKFINSHYREQLSLKDLADKVSISQYHFSRVFKRDCGYSPHEYLMIVRINRAMYLLKTTDLPIGLISEQVGYQNDTAFSYAFNSRIGMSPSEFRKFPI